MCKLDFTNVSDIALLLTDIEKELNSTDSDFSSFQERINGTNLLRILNALYFDDFLQIWQIFYPQHFNPDKSYGFKYAFSLFFGFQPKEKHMPIPLFRRIKEYSENYQASSFCAIKAKSKEKIKARVHAESADYEILQLPGDNNIASYSVNNCCTVDVCLVGRPELASASELLACIVDLEKALTDRDVTAVRKVVSIWGDSAALSITGNLYYGLVSAFIIELAEKKIKNREKVFPRMFLESFFHCPPEYHAAYPFFIKLLSELEARLPGWNKKLIAGNQTEMQTEKDCWALYYYAPNSASAHCCMMNFNWMELNSELRSFCRAKTEVGKKKFSFRNSYAHLCNIDLALNILSSCDVRISSIKELTKSDVVLLLSCFLENTDYNLGTIRYSVECLNVFYRYITKIPNSDLRSPFHGIAIPREKASEESLTKPVSKQVIEFIKIHLNEFPDVIKIGYKISLATAIRGEAFSHLTTDCLIGDTGNYRLRVFFKKTYVYRIETGRNTFQDYFITDAFAEEIKFFVRATEHLRAQLHKPYLLVFINPMFREGSHRKPSVLSNVYLRDYLNKFLQANGICDMNGVLETCSLRQIRAEIGRSLFSSGKAAEDVSIFLGNSPPIAQQHYNNSTPHDEANLYNTLYNKTLAPVLFLGETAERTANDAHSVLYGSCLAEQPCDLPDCENCSKRIVMKGDST